MIIQTRIQGIPCCVRFLGADEDGCEFEILDRREREAPWLQRKATYDDLLRIEKEIIEFYRYD